MQSTPTNDRINTTSDRFINETTTLLVETNKAVFQSTVGAASDELARVSGIFFVDEVFGVKKKGITERHVVSVNLSGADDDFGLVSGFAKRVNRKSPYVDRGIMDQARILFDKGTKENIKLSASSVFEGLEHSIRTDWRARVIVTEMVIKAWFANWATKKKATGKKAAANEIASRTELVDVDVAAEEGRVHHAFERSVVLNNQMTGTVVQAVVTEQEEGEEEEEEVGGSDNIVF